MTTGSPRPVRALIVALALNAAIIIGEFTIGLWIHSVGVMTDAWHNLIDQGSLFLSLYAHVLSLRPATPTQTFGYVRAGVLAAFANSVILVGAAVTLGAVAIGRLHSPTAVPGAWVLVTSLFAFAANLTIALLLRQSAAADINLRSAFWHMMGDAWVSFGVAAGGLLIWLRGWYVLDPLVSLVIVVVILKGAFSIIKDCVRVLMEAAPPGLRADVVAATIQSTAGVTSVHDVHLWELKPGLSILSCHVQTQPMNSVDGQRLLHSLQATLAQRFGLKHLTLQIDSGPSQSETSLCALSEHP